MRRLAAIGSIALALAALPGCYGYAPPMRLGFDGMPDPVGTGGGSVAAQYGVGGTAFGDARVAVGVGHGIRVAFGGSAASTGIMGNAGARFTLVDGPLVSLDLGTDFGVGRGGQESNVPDSDPNAEAENESRDNDAVVLGGAVDLTLGLRFHPWGGLYIPVRVQVTDAVGNDLVPITLYHQVGVGWQADWTKTLFTRLDAGYFGLSTLESTGVDDPQTEFGWTASVGFGARWGGGD